MVARALNSGDLKIYLPQKDVVLLDWWFDFVGNKKNILARCDQGYWNLLSEVWTKLQDDQETLSRIYLSHSFLTILSDTLGDFTKLNVKDNTEDGVRDLIYAISNAIKILGTSGLWFRVASDTANAIIFSYLKSIEYLKFNYPKVLVANCTLQLNQEISNVLQATLYGTSDLKKMSAMFNSKCLGVAFVALGFELPDLIHSTIKSAVSALLFENEQSSDIEFNTISPETLDLTNLDNKSTLIQSALHLYSIICVRAPKKAAAAFFSLTQIYPQSIKKLIKVAGENQIKISTESLAVLSDHELKKKIDLDWELLERILELDSTVVTEENRVKALLSTESAVSDAFSSFSRALIKYYAEARELVTFILSWKIFIRDSSPWCGDDVLHFLSIHLKSLSVHQMKGLLKSLVEPIRAGKSNASAVQVYIPIIAVVMSFFLQQSPPAVVLYDPLFSILDSNYLADSELFWHAKYLILSLNAAVVQRSAEAVLKQAKEAKYGLEIKADDGLPLNIMQIIFRIREFVVIDKFDSICKKMIKFVEKKATDPERFLRVINQRWLLIANTCFDEKNRSRLIELFAQHEKVFQELCQNEVMHEQRNLSQIVVTQIASGIDETKPPNLLQSKLISALPMEIVRRENRVKILNTLSSISFDEQNIEYQINIRTAINRFLERPTVSTPLETRPDVLRNYFTALGKTDDEQLEAVTASACERVIQYHASNSNTQEEIHTSYLQDLIEHEKKFLSKLKPNKSLSSSKRKALDFSCLIAATVPAEMAASAGLNKLLIRVLLEQLEKKKDSISSNLQSTLLIFRNLDRVFAPSKKLLKSGSLHTILGGYVVHAIQTLENDRSDVHSRQLLVHCFHVLVRTSNSDIEIETIVALYLILSDFDIKVDDSLLHGKIEKLDDTQFTRLFRTLVSDSFAGSVNPYSYFRTAAIFASAADVKIHVSCVEHFIRFVSLTSCHASSLDGKSLVAFIDLIDLLLKEKTWIITQYALELIVSAITEVSSEGPELDAGDNQDEIYVAITRVVSSILLFHRHRINGRYFLLTKVFSILLAALSNPSHVLCNSRFCYIPESLAQPCELQLTEKSAVVYSRLLENLCEPPIQAIRERGGKSNLTSASTIAKRQVSKFIGIILINYIRLTLQTGFSGAIKKALTPGFYLVFDILGEEKLRNTNFLLDANSRPYFKTLYEDYMAHGKWKND